MNIEEKISKIINECINIQLEMHGGSASLTHYEDDIAWIKFHGACSNCLSSSDTLETVVKQAIMTALPEVKDVRLDDTISEDLLDMAKKILSGQIK